MMVLRTMLMRTPKMGGLCVPRATQYRKMMGSASGVAQPAQPAQLAQLAQVKTKARPSMRTTTGSWMSAIPFACGPEKGCSRRVGELGAELLRHERRRWLHIQPRGTTTLDWDNAMTLGADHFQKYLATPEFAPTQLEAICRACSDPANASVLSSDRPSPDLSIPYPEKAPKFEKGEWNYTAWFVTKDFTRHEKSAEHLRCMLRSFPELRAPTTGSPTGSGGGASGGADSVISTTMPSAQSALSPLALQYISPAPGSAGSQSSQDSGLILRSLSSPRQAVTTLRRRRLIPWLSTTAQHSNVSSSPLRSMHCKLDLA